MIDKPESITNQVDFQELPLNEKPDSKKSENQNSTNFLEVGIPLLVSCLIF